MILLLSGILSIILVLHCSLLYITCFEKTDICFFFQLLVLNKKISYYFNAYFVHRLVCSSSYGFKRFLVLQLIVIVGIFATIIHTYLEPLFLLPHISTNEILQKNLVNLNNILFFRYCPFGL